MKLALHPDAAKLFDIESSPFRSFLIRRSPWLIAIFVILTPNMFGGVVNFLYNRNIVTKKGPDGFDVGIEALRDVSWYVNATFFPMVQQSSFTLR